MPPDPASPNARRSIRRRVAFIATALAVVAVSATVALTRSASPTAAAPDSHDTTTTTSPPSTMVTTTAVVTTQTLAPHVTEVATVRGSVDPIAVVATAPPGWDSTLTPVVRSDEPLPPRSGLDIDRVTLPSAAVPIAGRHVSDTGWQFSNPGLYQPPQPLVFGVVERQGTWVQVQLPVRPNGTTGWIRSADVDISTTTLQVEVSITRRDLVVTDDGVEVFRVPVAVGKAATPTPTGSFYVTDIVPSVDPGGPYGPVALALNSYSETLDQFAGESADGSPDSSAPVVALHGTNRPATVGRAMSNGCPRLYDGDVVALATLVPTGTPVAIWP